MADIEEQIITKQEERKECPYWAGIIPCTILVIADILLCYYVIDKRDTTWYFPTYTFIFGIFCFCWWFVLIVSRIIIWGKGGVYDIYWFCNIALLISSIGCMLRLPTLIGQSMCLLFFPHSFFWIDCLCYPCLHRALTNTYEFMFQKETPIFEKIASLHHLWYFPCVIAVLWKQPLMSIWSYVLSIALFVILNIVGYYMSPLEYKYEDGTTRYLNVCLGHEYPTFVRNIPPFKWTIGKHFVFHCLTITGVYIIPVNFLTYLIILGFQKLILNCF